MSRIYLDHAATTPLRPEAREAMAQGFAIWANPSSPHADGRRARAALEEARARVKAALGWEGELIFTSGASEALAIGLQRAKVERRIASAVEHDAVFRAAPDAEVIPMDADGGLDCARLEEALGGAGRALLAVQTVNSEAGRVILRFGPSDDGIAALVREKGGLLLADCSQSAGKLPLPPADMIVVSAHKLGGPVGIGALLLRDLAMLRPSGGHERGYRAGTENLPAALGFAAALEAGSPGDWQQSWQTTAAERAAFRREVMGASAEGVPAEGAAGDLDQVDYILPLTHPRMSAQAALIRLDAMGFSVSAGSACSSGSLKPSRVLLAFGIGEDIARRTIRVSLGWSTTRQDLDAFAAAWQTLCEEGG